MEKRVSPELSVSNHVKSCFIFNYSKLMLFFVKLPVTQRICRNCFAFYMIETAGGFPISHDLLPRSLRLPVGYLKYNSYVCVSSALHLMQTWKSLNSDFRYKKGRHAGILFFSTAIRAFTANAHPGMILFDDKAQVGKKRGYWVYMNIFYQRATRSSDQKASYGWIPATCHLNRQDRHAPLVYTFSQAASVHHSLSSASSPSGADS